MRMEGVSGLFLNKSHLFSVITVIGFSKQNKKGHLLSRSNCSCAYPHLQAPLVLGHRIDIGDRPYTKGNSPHRKPVPRNVIFIG